MYLTKLILDFAKFSTKTTTKLIIEPSKNLINPKAQDPVAFGYYFPTDWGQDKIYSLINPTKSDILSIKIIQNKFGQPTGKILFTFKTIQIMQKYIRRYNQDFIQTEDSVHRVILKKFELKSQLYSKQKAEYNTKYGVNLTNMDFDIDKPELERLTEDFGEIQFIELKMKQNGLNMGRAKIYFKTKQAAIDFKNFADGFKYKDRKLKCNIILPESELNKQSQIKQVLQPKIVMKWNQELYNRIIKNSSEQSF